jgi:hypothetical protein
MLFSMEGIDVPPISELGMDEISEIPAPVRAIMVY